MRNKNKENIHALQQEMECKAHENQYQLNEINYKLNKKLSKLEKELKLNQSKNKNKNNNSSKPKNNNNKKGKNASRSSKKRKKKKVKMDRIINEKFNGKRTKEIELINNIINNTISGIYKKVIVPNQFSFKIISFLSNLNIIGQVDFDKNFENGPIIVDRNNFKKINFKQFSLTDFKNCNSRQILFYRTIGTTKYIENGEYNLENDNDIISDGYKRYIIFHRMNDNKRVLNCILNENFKELNDIILGNNDELRCIFKMDILSNDIDKSLEVASNLYLERFKQKENDIDYNDDQDIMSLVSGDTTNENNNTRNTDNIQNKSPQNHQNWIDSMLSFS